MSIPIRREIFTPGLNLKDKENKKNPEENKQETILDEEATQQVPLPTEASCLDILGDYNIGLVVRRAVNKPLDGENNPNAIQPDGYENGFVFESLEEALKTMKLRATSCKGVYCEIHNPNMPLSNYTHQRHYVWNEAKHQMIELKDIYYLDSQGSQAKGLDGYEEICAYQQGYNFTEEPGVYEKDGIKYSFDITLGEFVAINEENCPKLILIDDFDIEDNNENSNPTTNTTTVTTTVTQVGDETKKIIEEKDSEGNLVSRTEERYSKDGTLYFKQTEYYENGNLKVSEGFDKNQKISFRDEFYDNGNLKSTRICFEEKGITKYTEYNESGHRIFEEWRNSADIVTNRIEYFENGKMRENTEYYDNGNIKLKEEYYENGKIKQREMYSEDGVLQSVEKYNEDGTVYEEPPIVIEDDYTIDIYNLFGDKDEFGLSDFINLVYQYGTDSNNEICNIIQNVITNINKSFYLYSEYDTMDAVKALFTVINRQLGIENKQPFTISKETLIEMNKNGILDNLDKIIRSEEFKNEYYLGADGYIDDFGQGATGDCWLLAAIISLNSSEAGRQIIKDSITIDDNGNIIVTFKGIGISYTITHEEMVEAQEVFTYSAGDNDVLALELATEKLRRDISAEKISLDYGNYGAYGDNGLWGQGINGGQPEYMIYYLTGNEPSKDSSMWTSLAPEKVMEFLKNHYKNVQEGSEVIGFALSSSVTVTTIDGKTFNYPYDNIAHAFAIVDITEDTVTIVNPWASNEKYTFTWEEFLNLGKMQIYATSTDLLEREYKTDWNNEIDYEKSFKINGKDYSFNEILQTDGPYMVDMGDSKSFENNLEHLIKRIIASALSDIEPDIAKKVESYVMYLFSSSYRFEETGTIQNGNNIQIDLKNLVESIISITKVYTLNIETLEEYDTKIDNGEFDFDVNQDIALKYGEIYINLMIDNYKSQNTYDENFIKLLNNFIGTNLHKLIDETGNNKLNLKSILENIKQIFNELIKKDTEKCSSDLNTGSNPDQFILFMIDNEYNMNSNNIHYLNIDGFKEGLIKYIAEKYNCSEELINNGNIDLAKIITDSNRNGSWLDELYDIIKEFAHKDDDKGFSDTVDCDATFTIEGRELSINDILNSDEEILITVSNNYNYSDFMQALLDKLERAMLDILPEKRKTVINALKNYYTSIFLYYANNYEGIIYDPFQDKIININSESVVGFGVSYNNGTLQINLKELISKLFEFINKAK